MTEKRFTVFRLAVAAAMLTATFWLTPERALAQTSAFTQCTSDADCAGQRCIKADEKICEEQKKLIQDACSGRSENQCSGLIQAQSAFQDVDLTNYNVGLVSNFVCKWENGSCAFKEDVFNTQFCQNLKHEINGSDRYRGKKYCSVFGLQPAAAPAEGPPVNIEFRPPLLSIPVPGIPEFSEVKLQGPEGQRYYIIPWLAQYLEAIYRYALSIIGVVATVMVVYGGIRWLTAAGNMTAIGEAKKVIGNAVIGLIIALGSYLILFTINPEIVKFRALRVAFIEQATLPLAYAEIAEGEGESGTGAGRPGAGAGGCAHYAQEISSQGIQCQAGSAMPSPTGLGWNCNYHTQQAQQIRGSTPSGSKPLLDVKSLDIIGAYGAVIKAPVAGVVKLKPGKREDCRGSTNGRFAATCPSGNRLEIQFGNGYQYNMAHISEFLVSDGTRVEAGQSIAKVGGKCCRVLNGERFDTPEWKTKTSWTGHFWNDGCTHPEPNCRPPWETGNAPGPHVHVSITLGEQTAIPILACVR
ncbi:hypothetical protein A3F28_00875 [Candidatus Uhrbacteria bacterium RIFCSPHIGHO2_12_FULL_57_11]|uniref:M23ase beta-sheet core domain-containing protein n=2 Tax=Candidatus Uhriibacteriota TaxID=1752732 RepID=A0A1F7UGI5_9BACT|nr:MAG: hypothetical protein A3D72_01630 [Candidatus Uhrbacteria bacterium RIFCSPHIGHO2_02_FULL_57_19]OGL77379.1 MAG: hypothetical protein A3F28_00875 [Candidatus Uhrbacteria bacterium RIFCSPHIGHO2_12_FULL_57_11]